MVSKTVEVRHEGLEIKNMGATTHLAHEAIESSLFTNLAGFVPYLGGESDDWNIQAKVSLDCDGGINSIHDGHAEIHEDDVVESWVGPDHVYSFLPMACCVARAPHILYESLCDLQYRKQYD